MAVYEVLPDTLDVTFVRGDELNILLDFDQNLTGYTFETKIIKVLEVSGGNVTSSINIVDFTQTNVSLSLGQINLSLDESVTGALELGGNYRWYMRWVAPGIKTRTVLSGAISVRSP
jgi:hypothetical protein